MGLIDIPPYVLAGETPPHHETEVRAFHLRTWEVPPPIEFPREVFAEALAVHARLLGEHGGDVLGAPLVDEGESHFFAPGEIGFACALLVGQGVAVEIHKWRRQEVSFVVQRCRGIVRQLMEDTDLDRMYVAVVAAGAASLHLARAHSPRRVGDRPRLEVVGPALVVEPWEQWHRRVGDALITTWRTPAGDEVASRVAAPRARWTLRAIADALVHRYESSAHRGLARYREESPRGLPAVLLTTAVVGEELHFLDRRELESWCGGFPGLAQASRTGPQGLVPVLVDGGEWAALAWMASGRTDVATPPARYEWHESAGPCPGPSVPDLIWMPHRGQPRPKAAPRAEPERGPEYWRDSLANSLARLVRLVDLAAPPNIIDHERRLARERMAKLEPADAEAVLRAWPRAARLLGRASTSTRPKPDSQKPN